MTYLQVQGLDKTYAARGGGTYHALKGVDFSVEGGEFVSIIGHSGCGKSTVLNLVAGLVEPSSGAILVNGKPVTGPGPDRMVAFQNHSLLPWLTLRENIALAVNRVHTNKSKQERAKLVDDHLAMVKLTPAANRYPDQVSGGMKQRCGIARALSTHPKVLLLDEPFGALDALTRAKLQDELIRICNHQKITVLMITHDVDEALLLSDRIIMMGNGPAAKVAEIMTVDLPRPRERLAAIEHPSYYRQRDELIYFLQSCKKAKKSKTRTVRAPNEISLGFVPLVDCAPFLVAKAEGLFTKHGLNVHLSRERSWKTTQTGVKEGRLHAAQMVVGMPFLEALNAGSSPAPVRTAMVLSRGGNAITFGRQLTDTGVTDRRSLSAHLQALREAGEPAPFFGMVHPASMHNLLLRAWLADGDINPDLDIQLSVIPPPQMIANLEQGNIAGYCVGEPWNVRAAVEKLGRVVTTDREIWADHPEKVLGVDSTWADKNPKAYEGLVRALLEACAICDGPEYRSQVLPDLLAHGDHVGGRPEDFSACLTGPYDRGDDHPIEDMSGYVQFSGPGKNVCRHNEASWVVAQLARWGIGTYPADPSTILSSVIDCDVLAAAASHVGLSEMDDDSSPISVGSGPAFDPTRGLAYLESLRIKGRVQVEGQGPSAAA